MTSLLPTLEESSTRLRPHLEALRDQLELAWSLLIGRSLLLERPSPELLDPVELRLSLPERALALGFEWEQHDGSSALCLLERSVADRLLSPVLSPEIGQRHPRDSRAGTVAHESRLAAVAAIVAKVMAKALRSSRPTPLAVVATALEGTSWEGADPLGGSAALVISFAASVEGEANGLLRIVLPWPALLDDLPHPQGEDEPLPPLPVRRPRVVPAHAAQAPKSAFRDPALTPGRRPTPRRAVHGRGPPTVMCVAPHGWTADLFARLKGVGVAEVADLDQVRALLSAGTTLSLLLVWIARDNPGLIERLSRFAEELGISRRAIFVLLEEPVRAMVVQCGRLGFLNVIPGAASIDQVARRIRGLSTQARPPTPPPQRRRA